MRVLLILLLAPLAGCSAPPPEDGPSPLDEASPCPRVYDPLFDPAGPRRELEAFRFSMPASSIDAGCFVFGDRASFEGARARGAPGTGESPEVDFERARVVALRAPAGAATECVTLGIRDVYGLPQATVVATTRQVRPFDGACPEEEAVLGVLVPRDGTTVTHAHDEPE